MDIDTTFATHSPVTKWVDGYELPRELWQTLDGRTYWSWLVKCPSCGFVKILSSSGLWLGEYSCSCGERIGINNTLQKLNKNDSMKNEQVADAGSSAKNGAFLSGLRVRIKELAQEARYIRFEENKIKSKQKIQMEFYGYVDCRYVRRDIDDKSKEFLKLRYHRTEDVRKAARAAQLAYGFLRDVPYKRIESNSKPRVGHWEEHQWLLIVKEVKRLATKFSKHGKTDFEKEIENWLTT